MRSLFAALRNLVLPAGATSGQRIILDGVNGRIFVYNPDGDLIGWLAPSDGVDPAGIPYFAGVGMNPYESSFPTSATRTSITLEANNGRVLFTRNPNGPGATTPFVWDGEIRGYNPNGTVTRGASLYLTAPGTHASDDHMTLIVRSVSSDGATESHRLDVGPEEFYTNVARSEATRTAFAGFLVRKTYSGGAYTDEGWKNLPLQNGWTAVVGNAPQYRLDADGSVYLRGWINNGVTADNTVFAALPAGYRPAYNHTTPSANPFVTSFQKIDVEAGGNMKIFGLGGVAWISLGIAPFKVAAIT